MNNNTEITRHDVTDEMVDAHRDQLERNVAATQTAYYNKPAGSDADERAAMAAAATEFNVWCSLSQDEQRSAVARVVNEDNEAAAAGTEIPEQPIEIVIVENTDPAAEAEKLILESQADALARLEREVSNLRADAEGWRERYNNAMRDQLHGDDPRLTEFWELAGDKADRAGFCEQYDILAEAMGGPTRTVSYNVEHTLTVHVSVSAYSYQSAARNATSGDFESYEDSGYDDDVDERIKEAIENGNYTIESSSVESWEESD